MEDKQYLEKFNTKYIVDASTGCWNWTGKLNAYGYPVARRHNHIGGHRVSYYLHKSSPPAGVCVCHSCDNRSCVNPDHLFLGSNADNVRDRHNKGRTCSGENRPQARLTEQDVIDIRSRYIPRKVTLQQLANEYGVNNSHIWHIVNGTHWKGV